MSVGRHSSILSARLVALLALGVAGASSSAGCGMENALVEGACADGYQLCGSVCVNIQNEVGNCGACGNVCLSGDVCTAGRCGPPGAAPSKGPDGGANGTGTAADGGAGGPSSGEGGPGDDGGATSDDGGTTNDDGGQVGADGPADGAGGDGGKASDGGGSTGDGGGSTGDDGGAPATGDGGSGTERDGGRGTGSDGGTTGGADAAAGSDATTSSSDAGTPGTNDAGTNDQDSSTTDSPDAAVLACVPPLVRCEGVCTDVQDDPFNCGVCGHFCPTFICAAGQCVGSLPGQVVLIGHDYATGIPEATPQARVLINTIFGSGSPTVRVLAYQQYAAPQAVGSVAAILDGYARATHRQIAITPTSDPADVPSKLNPTDFDALLVMDEPNAPPGVLGGIGTRWASIVQSYATAGGTVVVLDGATAPEMPALVTNAGMFTLNTQSRLGGSTQVVNLAPGDSVGSGVESPYLPTQHSAFFQLSDVGPNITSVVFDQADGAPVVVQRVFKP